MVERNDSPIKGVTADGLPVNELPTTGSKSLENDSPIKDVTDDGLPVNDLAGNGLPAQDLIPKVIDSGKIKKIIDPDLIAQVLNSGKVNLPLLQEQVLRMTRGIPCDDNATLDYPGSGRGHEGQQRTSLEGLKPVDLAEVRFVRDSVVNVMMAEVERAREEARVNDDRVREILNRINS